MHLVEAFLFVEFSGGVGSGVGVPIGQGVIAASQVMLNNLVSAIPKCFFVIKPLFTYF